jgi:hypothetical protein
MDVRIIAAMNAMIENKSMIDAIYPISHIVLEGFVFEYKKKYKWAIIFDRNDDEYFLIFYANTFESTEHLALQYPTTSTAVYSTEEYKDRESVQTFKELFQTVRNKLYGIDAMLDDIIGPVSF